MNHRWPILFAVASLGLSSVARVGAADPPTAEPQKLSKSTFLTF